MKTSTIKNYSGQKTLIVNDIKNADVEALYIQSRKMGIAFAVKQDIGVQYWGLFTVADFLGYSDCSVLSAKINEAKSN